jgi:hypothetical protein
VIGDLTGTIEFRWRRSTIALHLGSPNPERLLEDIDLRALLTADLRVYPESARAPDQPRRQPRRKFLSPVTLNNYGGTCDYAGHCNAGCEPKSRCSPSRAGEATG